MPPGSEDDGYNLTMVVSVSDTLGSTAASNLGFDGAPMIISSIPPQEVQFTDERSRALARATELLLRPVELRSGGLRKIRSRKIINRKV